GEMAGGVAHDFNNILAAILGRAQLLLQSVDDPGIRRQLGVVEQAALDGAQTVRRVQEFTRVRQDERFETLDLNRVLHGVVELTRPAWEAGAKRRGVVVNLHLDLTASQSIAGAASELTLTFPIGAVAIEHGPSADGPAPMALRVLVADDEESVLTVLDEMLRGMGHQVTPALGGPAAVDALRHATFDVVFTDLGMPE